MEHTVIRISCIDQTLKILEAPIVASGGVKDTKIIFEFSDIWDDFIKTAVFMLNDNEPYQVVIDSASSCIIPAETLVHMGILRIGVYGVSANGVKRTTSLLRYNIAEGALEGVEPTEPTPDIYEQILEEISKFSTSSGGKSAYDTAVEGGYKGTEEDFAKMLAFCDTRLDELEKKMKDALYESIVITEFSSNVNIVEIGSIIDTVTLSWALNKAPETLTLNGVEMDVGAEGVSLSGIGLSSGKTWTLAATDERGASASRSTSISFLNGVYYGVLAEGAVIDSASVLTLTRKLQSGKAVTFTVTAGAAQRIAFALPSRYGAPVFSVGGFEGGFELAATLDFENVSGYTETYNVWLSSRTGLGTTTMSVK